MKKSNQGFTLIELVISILIISIVATITIPGIVSYQNKQAEDTFVNQYINQLRTLQSISLTKDVITGFTYDSVNKVVSFCEVAINNCKTLNVPNVLQNTTFLTGYFFDKYGNVLDSTKNPIVVDPLNPDLSNLSITTNLYKIIINPAGGIFKQTLPASEPTQETPIDNAPTPEPTL